VTTNIVSSSHSVYVLEAEISQDGQIKATAEGKFADYPNLMNENRKVY